MGKEFYNADVQKILKKHIIQYSTYLMLEVSDRAIQSHAQKRHVYTQLNGLNCHVSFQVTTCASTIGMRPADIIPAERLLDTV